MSFYHIFFIIIGLAFSAQAMEKPNVLILYADDLGYGDLGCYNKNSKIPTPHLDQLAADGMRFNDGHSSSGICTPSRYALLTGRHHWRKFHGIVGAFGQPAFDEGRLTMASMLKDKGYATACIGKWHLGWDWKAAGGKDKIDWTQPIPGGPLARGFDYYFGDTVINFPPYCWIENDKVTDIPTEKMDTKKWKKIKEGNWECRPGPMAPNWDPYENIPTTTKKGVEYIKQQAKTEEPFFLYFAYPSPHAPIIPNDEFDGKSQAGPYGDFVYETDDSIGQLLKALEESGQADNTLVIFSADNGPEHYAYPREEKYDHWSSFPLRGLKRDIYEGGHRVPFIIKWPGKVPAGVSSDALISQIDMMSTVANIVGYALPKDQAEDSHNQLDLITGKSSTGTRQTHIHNTYDKKYAIRDGDWLLVDTDSGYAKRFSKDWEKKNGYDVDEKKGPKLYNMKKDLSQKNNLIAQHPEKAESLRALMKQVIDQGYSAPRLAK